MQLLKTAMAGADERLGGKFEAGEDVNQLVRARAWVVEQLVLHAWDSLVR